MDYLASCQAALVFMVTNYRTIGLSMDKQDIGFGVINVPKVLAKKQISFSAVIFS